MKVAELIELLRQFDPQEEVVAGCGNAEDDILSVEMIDEERDGRFTRDHVHCRWVRINLPG